jgi:stearoyl-CoA desaturase (delta-9 desaturase)
MDNPSEKALQPKVRRLLWTNILFMTLNPLAAAILTPLYIMNHGFTWGMAAFLIITYTISNMSITTGYHRYFSHRSYNAHPLLEALFIFVAAGAFQGSILAWCTDHRRHHRMVDTDADPYSINKGFWYAHLLWMFRSDPHPEAKNYPKDLTKNPLIVFQHKHYALIATFMGYFVPGFIGMAFGWGFWGGAIIGGSLRIALSQQSTFLINSAAHTFGKQTYTEKNSAKDSFIMAVLTFGEGYHNFHHYFQADYRNGIRWYQWDPTKWAIRILSFFGLASKLKEAHKDEILKARLAMEEAHMLSRGASAEKVSQLKTQIVEAARKLREMRDEYLQKKHRLELRSQEVRRSMRAEIRTARNEFQVAYTQWRTLRRSVRRAATA